DIHVEPVEGGVIVRYRIDGVLRQVMKIPRSAGIPLISRMKIMSGMDIADRLRPQDGRCRVSVNGNPVDLRVSTLPASHGENVVQVQVNEKAGLTFAAAVRSILRQDPDVVLVGEIRDRETAQIAVQASLTGHLVLSTLHTNDAPNTVTRLVDMGMEAYKIAAALRGVVAQRLMRRLCQACRTKMEGEVPPQLREYIPGSAALYQAVGCAECTQTGYRGRFGIV